jgi:hypothetical protein
MKPGIAPPLPAAPKANTDNDWQAIVFNVEFEGVLALTKAHSTMARWLQSDMERALCQAGVVLSRTHDPDNPGHIKNNSIVIGRLNWLSGLFFVSDWQKGLSTLEAEFERTGLVNHAEIGWLCPAENILRRYLPKPSGDTFDLLLLKWEAPPLTPKLATVILLFGQGFATGFLNAGMSAAAILASLTPPAPGAEIAPAIITKSMSLISRCTSCKAAAWLSVTCMCRFINSAILATVWWSKSCEPGRFACAAFITS